MAGPALVFWIIGAPFVVAVVSLVRTVSTLKSMPASKRGRGPWSRALHIDGA